MFNTPNKEEKEAICKLLGNDDFTKFLCSIRMKFEIITKQTLLDLNLDQDQVNIIRGMGIALKNILDDVELVTKTI